MLKKQNKLSKKDIKSLKNKKYTNKKGVFFNNVIYLESGAEKICVIISKRNIKKANKRNLLRRKIYYIFNNFISNTFLPKEEKEKENKVNIIYINKNVKEEDLNKLNFENLKQEIISIFN